MFVDCVCGADFACLEFYSVVYWYTRKKYPVMVTVTNLSQASLGRPSPRALKPRLRYKLNHGVVGGVYYNLYTRGARPGRVVCLWCSCEYVGWALARLAPPSGRAASRAWSRVARRVGGR